MEKFTKKMEKKLARIWDEMKIQKEINELQKSQIFISQEYETMKKTDETKEIEKNFHIN